METGLPIRIMEAVGLLHCQGYGSLRILPGMNASGTAWRISIFDDTAVTDPESNPDPDPDPDEGAECIYYSSAGFNEFNGTEFNRSVEADQVARLILSGLPGLQMATGRLDYVRWYAGLIDRVESLEDLPVAYADYFDSSKGWELGWCSGRFFPEPPIRPGRD